MFRLASFSPDRLRELGSRVAEGLQEANHSHTLFVFCTGIILSGYTALAVSDWGWSAPVILILCAFFVIGCPVAWIISSFLSTRDLGLPLKESLQKNSFPFSAFILLLVFVGEFLLGAPSSARAASVLSMSIMLFYLFKIIANSSKFDTLYFRLESISGYLIFAIVLSHGIILTAMVVLRHYHFGSVLGEDTGYYNQIFWSTLHGEFFKGSLTQARYFAPPVHSEFAVHNSPVLFLVLPIYWIFPSFYTLLILRNLALAVSAVPLYLLARERISGVAGILIVLAYFLSANIFYQTLNGFYPLHFVALFLSFCFFFFYKERFILFLVFLVLSLSVREEIALTTFLFGFYALMLKRRWHWVVIPAGLSLLWWYISTEWVMVRSQITMEDLDRFFEFFGSGHNEVVKTFLTQPGKVLEILFTRGNFSYLYTLAKPAGMLSFLSLSSVFMAPTVVINAVIGHFMGTMREISYHYSLLASVCLFHALVHGLALLSRSGRYFRLEKSRFGTAVALLLLPIMVLGLADAVRYGGGENQSLRADFVRKPYHETLEKILELVEPDAAVAAPNILLPQLSYRGELYISNRLWRYPEVRVDYIIMDANVDKLSRADQNKDKYEASLAEVRSNSRNTLIFKEHGFEVYKVHPLSERGGKL